MPQLRYDASKRPHSSPNTKVDTQIESWILSLRKTRKLGARNQVKPLVIQRKKKDYQRYERPIHGDRVQMDTCKIAPSIYQYTVHRSAANTLLFLDQVLEEMLSNYQRDLQLRKLKPSL